MRNEIPDDYVRMSKHQCPVCGVVHEHNTEILINKKLRSIKDEHLLTGYSLCKDHDKLFDDGFIALIVIDEPEGSQTVLKEENVCRTGKLIHMRRTVFNDMFDVELPDDLPMTYINNEVANMLESMEARTH